MIFYSKVRTVAKKLQQLRGKLTIYLNLIEKCGKKFRHYIIKLLDVEAQIKNLEKLSRSFGLDCRELKDDSGRTVYEVMSSNGVDAYIVRPWESDPYNRCECADCHYRGEECKHQKRVKQFKSEQSQKLLQEIADKREERIQAQRDHNIKQREKEKAETDAYFQALKGVACEAIEKAGIRVLLAEIEGFLSILTNHGWIRRYTDGWFIRTRKGQEIKCQGMDHAIELLKNPMQQFVDAPLLQFQPVEIYYKKDRVQIWKMPRGCGFHLLVVDSLINKIMATGFGDNKFSWTSAKEAKEWYECYLPSN
ncbi:MAG: hypothetical protein HC815_19585 [Richelia sp. RM1_1_1]|nr:hypothetical protein [Richelia sp. RM1_1_1]